MHLARWIIGISMNMGPTQSSSTVSIYRRKKGTLNWQTTSLFGDYGAEKQLLYLPHFVWWITLVIIVIVDTRSLVLRNIALHLMFVQCVCRRVYIEITARAHLPGSYSFHFYLVSQQTQNVLNFKFETRMFKRLQFLKVSLIYILDIRRGWRIKD